jgi:hypothetical protein
VRRLGGLSVFAFAPVLAVIGLVGFLTFHEDGFKGRYPENIQNVLAYKSYYPGKDARVNVCWMTYEKDTPYGDECYVRANTASQDGILIFGDSYAARLYTGIREEFGPNANIGQITRDSCPPLLNYSDGPCKETTARTISDMARVKPRTVVLDAAWQAYDQHWKPDSPITLQLEKTLTEIKRAGVPNIVLVGPAPRWTADLPDLQFADWESQPEPRRIATRLKKVNPVVYEMDSFQRTFAAQHGVKYVSLLDILCNKAGCLTSVPDRPDVLMAFDFGHFTTEGATFVAKNIREMGVLTKGS